MGRLAVVALGAIIFFACSAFRVDGGETLKITSLGSCERLICEAIRAHYLHRDEVAVHVLASSAFYLARDLVRHDCPERDQTELILTRDPKRRTEFWDAIRKLYNFFRHAGKSSPREMEIHDIRELNEGLIKLAVYDYLAAGGRKKRADQRRVRAPLARRCPARRRQQGARRCYCRCRKRQSPARRDRSCSTRQGNRSRPAIPS